MEASVFTVVSNEEILNKLLTTSSNDLVVLHFWAEWAPQCAQMNEVMLELSKEKSLASVHFATILAEELPEISLKYNVDAVPTFVLMQNKTVVSTVKGANAGELTEQLKQRAGSQIRHAASSNGESAAKVDENAMLKSLINKAPVMLFMKGSPDAPKCGFSKRIVKILTDEKVLFSSFDILTDETVRQSLKKFSDWPTYPQVYVKGELIGGLDIIDEMVQNGELKDVFPTAQDLNKRIKQIIKSAKIMLFMKGDKSKQRCGFSKKAVSLLNSKDVEYETFDILEDNEIRQGLKTFSNWPTYPQLYVLGSFVGGIDIIGDMEEAGELAEVLENGPDM